MSERAPLHLVACVGRKHESPMPAKDLYCSPWFAKARSYVERCGGRWFILSALHGLIAPNCVISPYNTTLKTMRRYERVCWSERALRDLLQMEKRQTVVVLAGYRYREFLVDRMDFHFHCVKAPLTGLRIGEQMQWLDRH